MITICSSRISPTTELLLCDLQYEIAPYLASKSFGNGGGSVFSQDSKNNGSRTNTANLVLRHDRSELLVKAIGPTAESSGNGGGSLSKNTLKTIRIDGMS